MSGEADLATTEVDARVAATLRARARALAAVPPDERGDDRVEVLRCRVGAEEYAIELRVLLAVQRAAGLTPVPCTPPHVAGLLNVRGEIVTVLDLGVALGLRGAPAVEPTSQVVLVDSAHGRVGLLVDAVLDVERLSRAALHRSLSGREFTGGVADARTVLLSAAQMLADERFAVYEEVS